MADKLILPEHDFSINPEGAGSFQLHSYGVFLNDLNEKKYADDSLTPFQNINILPYLEDLKKDVLGVLSDVF